MQPHAQNRVMLSACSLDLGDYPIGLKAMRNQRQLSVLKIDGIKLSVLEFTAQALMLCKTLASFLELRASYLLSMMPCLPASLTSSVPYLIFMYRSEVVTTRVELNLEQMKQCPDHLS